MSHILVLRFALIGQTHLRPTSIQFIRSSSSIDDGISHPIRLTLTQSLQWSRFFWSVTHLATHQICDATTQPSHRITSITHSFEIAKLSLFTYVNFVRCDYDFVLPFLANKIYVSNFLHTSYDTSFGMIIRWQNGYICVCQLDSRLAIKNRWNKGCVSISYKTALPHETGTRSCDRRQRRLCVFSSSSLFDTFVRTNRRDNLRIFFYFCLPMNLHNALL